MGARSMSKGACRRASGPTRTASRNTRRRSSPARCRCSAAAKAWARAHPVAVKTAAMVAAVGVVLAAATTSVRRRRRVPLRLPRTGRPRSRAPASTTWMTTFRSRNRALSPAVAGPADIERRHRRRAIAPRDAHEAEQLGHVVVVKDVGEWWHAEGARIAGGAGRKAPFENDVHEIGGRAHGHRAAAGECRIGAGHAFAGLAMAAG